ncbi:MAG: uroporphyrinogen decarboxylase family protein [Clostridiales Family XIII bacterium]|jgi:uroporphyrinogen decarboxylase|nr:uroporphyrinogen decarboxylase family protein [Clostridiales Family XIII bacterium]
MTRAEEQNPACVSTGEPAAALKAAFTGGAPARIPVGVCLGGSWPFFVEGCTLKELLKDPIRAAEIFYGVNERVDADFITVGTGATALMIGALGAEIRFADNGAPEIMSYLIEKEEDIEAADIAGALRSEHMLWLKDVAREIIRLNSGRRSIFVSGRAAFTLAGQMYGLERFSKALYKDKALAAHLLEFATDVAAAYYEFMLELPGLDGIFIADPSASGDVISRKHYESNALPYETELVRRLKHHDKLTLMHICGNITNRLDLLPSSGVQMISLDSKVDLAEARNILDGRLAISGNVNPVQVLEDLAPEEVYRATQSCLEAAGASGGGFMLLPGCDISYKVSEENIRAFVKAARDWREHELS